MGHRSGAGHGQKPKVTWMLIGGMAAIGVVVCWSTGALQYITGRLAEAAVLIYGSN